MHPVGRMHGRSSAREILMVRNVGKRYDPKELYGPHIEKYLMPQAVIC